MLKNYLKIALRNLTRNKISSFINVFGLTAGLTCFFIIVIYIANELSYDKFHKKADRTYRITREFKEKDGSTYLNLPYIAASFGPRVKHDFPEIEQVLRIRGRGMLFTHGEKVFNERVFMADENIFDVFSIELLKGAARTALVEPFSAVITQEIATKYFGEKDPLGQVIQMTSDKINVKITGIIKALPKNSSIRREIFVSFKTLYDPRIGEKDMDTRFDNNRYATFIVLPKKLSPDKIEAQFPAFLNKHMGEKANKWTGLHLQKLTDIHLYSSHLMDSDGDIKYVYIFSCIALLILIIACVNFINLTTAQSASRAKEIGIRKVAGAFRFQIMKQFLVETFVICVVSVLLAIILVLTLLPQFNQVIDKDLSVVDLNFLTVFLFLFGLILIMGLAAGGYPAFFLSRFDPVKVLKGKLSSGSRNTALRKVLVTFQFTITIILLVGTIVIYKQLQFMQTKELGYNKEQIIRLPFYNELSPNFEAFKSDLKRSAFVQDASLSDQVPSYSLSNTRGSIKTSIGNERVETPMVNYVKVDFDFIPIYELKLLAGRNFNKAFSTDSNAFIINESTLKTIGFTDPNKAIGKDIEYGSKKGRIVGVVKDVYFEAMYNPIKPMIFFLDTDVDELSIKIQGKNAKEALAYTEKLWKKYLPHRPFEYEFLSDSFVDLYKTEATRAKLFTGFSIFSIFIACLGLFGLISYSISLRLKEIGIRKVLGAPIASILNLLSKDYLSLVLFSNLFAWPLGYLIMDKWLQDFAYRIEWQWWYFALAGILAILIAVLTVSFQAIKAALVNPVKSLRTE